MVAPKNGPRIFDTRTACAGEEDQRRDLYLISSVGSGFDPRTQSAYRRSAGHLFLLDFEVGEAFELAVAATGPEAVDAGRFEDLAGGGAAGGVLGPAGAELVGEAVGAAEGVGLQLFGDAVAPAGGDLVDRLQRTSRAITADGVGERHGGQESQ